MCISEDGGRDSLGAMNVMTDWDVMNAPLESLLGVVPPMSWGERAGALSQEPCAWLWRRRCLLVWRCWGTGVRWR